MKCFRTLRQTAALTLPLIAVLLLLPGILQAQSVQDGNTRNSGIDIKFHKFQPAVAPESAVAAPISRADSDALTQQQILALEQDKATRTAAQQKIDSNILYTVRMLAGKPAASGVASLNTGVDVDDNNGLLVDITANVTDELMKQLNAAGALIWYSNARFHSIRAVVPATQIETIAASPDVKFISPKVQSVTSSMPRLHSQLLLPGFNQRAARVRALLTAALQSKAVTNGTGQGNVTTQGDATHRAVDARGTFNVKGSGLKIGVISDSANATGALTAAQATGDMPPTCPAGPPCFTLLQDDPAGATDGATDEGTAMMEIVFDMAPGASIFFATADISEASFAQNILNLRAAGCDIIVDDVGYLDEPVFQDGIVSQAVNSVTADGALYFSAAGNEGNVDSNTAGYFEGDFNDTGSLAFTFPGGAKTGTVHNFGTAASPVNGDIITSSGFGYLLNWADPQGKSANDYDLFLVSSTGVVKASSTNLQNGTQNPFETISPPALVAGDRLVVFKTATAAKVFFAINTFRGTLTVATPGQIFGHSADVGTGFYSVAATPAAAAFGIPGSPTGPFPNPFNSGNSAELFTSDGPRRIFFNPDGSAITPGNFSSTGGTVRAKPDITAADGVSTTLPPGSGLNPFYGTSAAAPAAAAVAALVKSANPALTQDQIRTALTSTAIDIMGAGNDRDSGAGIVMAWEAINSLGVVGTANPELGTITAVENPGNGNGIIEAGEGAKLTIQLANTGLLDATAISATLATSTQGVAVTQPATSTYPDLAAGTGKATNATPFTFTLASDSPCALSIDFILTVNYTGGPPRILTFSIPTGLVTLTSNLGTPIGIPGVTVATGQQTNRVNRNRVVSACGTPKAFPGVVTTPTTLTFDSYSFTACKSACLTSTLSSNNGSSMLEVAYAGTFDPANVATDYAGDPGVSSPLQNFGVTTTAATNYTIVVSDAAGTSAGSNYSLQFPACMVNCNVNQVPVAKAQNVTVAATIPDGTANANIDNGSFDPDGDAITITQNPPGPYPQGATSVFLTVTDTKGATAQAVAIVTVTQPTIAPPSIAEAFNPSTIAVNGTTSLTFTITNPVSNTVSLTGVAFTDTLPAGLTVASSTSTVCGGTLTTTAPTGIALSGATIAASSQCQFSVTVTGAVSGAYTNTTGAVTSTNGGTGNAATANLTVTGTAPAPTITKAFGAASILINTSASLTFNIQNPNTSLGLTGIAFTDALPAGLVVSTPNGLTSSCGGTTTAAAGSGSISLTGGTLAANASCSMSVNVTGIAVGIDNNTTGAISSIESGTGNPSNTATITIVGPPAITKAFGAASINLNATTTLTFTITNPNSTVALTGVGFADTLPTGLAVASPNGLTGSCGSGTIATGIGSVTLASGTIPAAGSCSFSVNVGGKAGGHQVNTTGAVTSTNAGSGNQATASIDVIAPDPTIAATHTGNFTPGQTGATFSLTVSNTGFGPTSGTVTVTDTLPNVANTFVPTAMSGTGWTCTLGTLTCTRADALASGSSYPAITLTVNVPQNIAANVTNTAAVSGGGDVNTNDNTATDATHIGPPLQIATGNSSLTVTKGSSGTVNFNVDSSPGIGTITFSCSGLPVGAACSFNPASENQLSATVTMTVSTSASASLVPLNNSSPTFTPAPVYAMVFPVLGLIGFGARNKKARRKLFMLAAGVVILLSLASCGSSKPTATGTPTGPFTLTVNASGTGAQATTTVTVTVQ